jgi:hypothetical protein
MSLLRQINSMRTVIGILSILSFLIIGFSLYERSPRHQEKALGNSGASVRDTNPISRRVAAARSPAPTIEVTDLAINWNLYRNTTVAVAGSFRCASEDYCAFARSPELRMTVVVDISTLPAPARRHLILDCKDGCDVIVVGNVDYDDIFALDVSDVRVNDFVRQE